MDKYKSAHRTLGYNLAPAAGSLLGFKASDKTKALLSAMRKGKPRSEETKAKIRASTMGRIASDETREKQRQSQLGKKQSEETKLKHAVNMKGNKRSQGSVRTKEHLDAMFEGRMKKKFGTW